MREQRGKVCALTGHRNLSPAFDENILYDTLEALIGEGYDCFLCGMAKGFDLTALECLRNLKQKYRLTIEACIPYEGQETAFSYDERKKYRELLDWCDHKTILYREYRNGCYLARDRYMVDCADIVLAYCKRETGGTAYTVDYANRKGIPVRFVG